MNHVKSNDELYESKDSQLKTAVKCWRHFSLPHDVEMIEIWMIRNSESFKADTSERKQKMNVIYFENIQDWPALNFVSQINMDFKQYCLNLI